ncbi:MAG: DivIVA domain-containing protein [Clostridia bacterium]|nr:DivIVA domain-containing protein [Clostridia bacterium]MDY5263798.1 DivIVA domain-containing protein [Eubacteriales bacterium]MDY5439547.1 DivIVA domain-containing protein [Eubacteriales bacterium]
MEGFRKVLRGYDEKEVNVFLTKLNDNFASVSQEQKERIDELKEQNEKLAEELSVYRKKEKLIERTLTEATRRAEDIESELKTQYALEIERLKIFQAKWTNCYEELKNKYHFDKDVNNMESLVINTKQTLIDKLGRLNIILPHLESEEQMQFDSESERITKLQEEQADRLVSELKNQIKELDEEFDYKEALTPKKSLEELCREIGLK